MAIPSPTASRSGLGRALRAAAALLAGLLVTTCADNPTAPNHPGFGAMRLRPTFDEYALFAPLVLNQVRAVVVRPPADTLIDTLRAFSPSDQQLTLALRLTLQSTRETMDVTLQLLAGQTLLFSGTEAVEVRQGNNPPSTSIPVSYQGPGANATSLVLAPVDTVLRVGSTAQLRATAFDVEGEDVGQFYLNWSLVGPAAGATVDATGLFHAPTAPGTVIVRGITPGGLRDSVQVLVVPAPATLAKSSGDNQSAAPGERLAQPLVVLVTGTGGIPVPGVGVIFAATTGGGQVDSATATTDANGIARSGVILGATVGVQTFTVASTGLTAAVFSATAVGPGPQTRTWSGAVSTDWSVPGNWVGGTAPAASDPAIIGTATRQPSLSATTVVGSVTINTGGVLTVNGQTLIISGDLTTAGSGIIKMTSASDGVGVTNNAVFGGGDENGSLTAGALQVGGNFTQLSSNSTGSYFATGSHTTAFTGATPTVTFGSTTGTASAFQNLAWNTSGGTSTMTLGSPLFVKGIFSVGGAGATGLTSAAGSRLTVLGDFAPVLPLVLNNVPLTIDQSTAGSTIFANAGLTFQNMATNVSQLVIRHPGQSAPVVLPGLTFSTVPVAPNGFYLDVTDVTVDANALTVNLTGATPASGGAFVKTAGGAIVNWPLVAGVRTWTGAVGVDWSVAGNWNGGVPGGSDSAVIVAATNAPQLSTETTVGAVSIEGGRLTINGQSLTVSRGLSTSVTGVLVMLNPADDVSITGNATFGGGDASDALLAGDLTIGGNLVQTSANSPFSFSASGSHVTLFTTGAHTISFASPGAPSGSGFNDLEFFGAGTTTLSTATWARGTMDINGAGQVFSSSNGSRLGIERLVTTTPVTFNNVPLLINQSQATAITNQPLTFQNMATNVVQLEINHPGGAGPVTLTNFVFSTVPVAPNGFYLSASDNVADATPLVINMTGATPATGAPFVQTAGGATVNWASGGTLRTWTGAVSTDWAVAGNWTGGVPANGDDVLIPEGTARFPLFTGSITLRNLTIDAESGETILTVNGSGGITVTGNLLNRGQIQGTAPIAVSGAGAHQVEGDFDNLSILAPVTLTGDLQTVRSLEVSGAGSLLDMSERTVTTGEDFSLTDGGGFTMNLNSTLNIGGNAIFDGNGSTIQGGFIQVAGDFTAGTQDGAFSPGNGNSVTLTGTGVQTITLGSGASYFENLAINKGDGSIMLASDVTVFGTLGGGGAGIEGPHTLTAGELNASSIAFDGVRLVWNALSADVAGSLSNAQFRNYSGTPPQFTINHPGIPSNVLAFDGLTFEGTPATFHLLVNDNANDGVPLVVNLTNADPASGAGLFNATNGATVNWPAAPTTWVWTGATSTNWSVAGNWDQNSIPGTNADVTIGAAANQPTLTADVNVNSVLVSTAGARLTLGGHTLTVAGNFTTHTDGLLVSTNPADKLIVGASAAFQGGDETGLITAGELRLNGDFTQQVQTSPLSFLASGSHRTIMTNASQLQTVRFCCTANTSKFMNLDISNSFGINIQFAANGVFVADTFIVQPGSGPRPWLYMLGSPLTARRFKINRLLVDRGTLTLNEAGVAGTQQLDSVTFQNYLTTQTQLAVTAPGTRTLTFNNLVFQPLTAGNTGRYINATSSTGTLTLDLPSANVGNGPAFTTINGNAIVNWPGATPVNTWSGAVSTAWTTAGNWSLGRIPDATDSVVIPNGVSNYPTLTGRQVVGAMFEDGRLTINGGTLVVTRGTASNTGINRIIQTTLVTDSLIIGGDVSTPISTILGVVVVGGNITAAPSIGNSRLVLNGAATQGVAPISGGTLIVDKPSGLANVGGFNGDSIDVFAGGLTSTGAITVATGLSTRSGTSLNLTGILTVSTSLNVAGSYVVGTTDFKSTAATMTIPALPYTNLTIENSNTIATVNLGARTVATGNLTVNASGTAVTLSLNGHTLVVGGAVLTTGISVGAIRMNNALDSLLVTGNATFSAPANGNPGFFTAGVLQVGGTFTQSSPFGGATFQSTGTHKVILTAFNPSVSFDNPGPATNQSRFNDLTWTGGGTLEVDGVDSLVIGGTFTTTSATAVTVLAPGVNRSIRFGSLAATAQVTFSQIRVIVSQPNVPSPGPDLGLNNMRFFNQDPAKVWLTIEHPGFTGGLSVSNLTFTTVPNNGGFYIRAVDNNPSDGLPLVVNVTNSTPTNGSGLVQVAGGATVNWPAVPGVATWTGAASTAWADPANWTGNAVPGSTTDVTIPPGTPFAPTAGAETGTSAHNLTVATGATLTLTNPFGLTANGNVSAPGTIAGGGTLSMTSVATLLGTVPNLNITNAVTLNGNTVVGGAGSVTVTGTAAELILGGFSFQGTGILFSNGARLSMTNPADSLVAAGTLTFGGGSTLGRLTAGAIEARASFIQQSSGSTSSFASTGTRVRATNSSVVTYTMQSGGPGQSQFSALLVSKSGGSLTLSGSLVPINDSMVVSSATSISVPGTMNPNKLRLAAGAGLTGVGSIQIIGDSLFVATPANYTIGNTLLYGTGAGDQKIPPLPYPSLTLENSSTHTLTARTATTGPVFIVNGILVLGGRTLSTAAGFQVQPDGQLRMDNANDSLLVGGNAFFQSTVDGTGNLTAGVLRVAQNMTVNGSVTGFAPSGTHKTILASVATSDVNWTGLGTTPIQFQDLEANANSLSMNYVRVNGTMTVTGSGGVNADELDVRGTLTTAPAAGMGINRLTLGAATPIAPGSGFINARVWVLDGTGPQSMPAIPSPSGPDSAMIIVRSQTGFTSNVILNGLRIEGDGLLEINEQTVDVFGDFATADNGRLFMQYALSRLNVTGATTFGGGSTQGALTAGILTTSGRFTQEGTNSALSFRAIGDHITRIATNYPGGNTVTFSNPTNAGFQHLELSIPVTWGSDALVYGNFTNTATGPMIPGRFTVLGAFTQTGNSDFTPRRLIYTGSAMSVTNGFLSPDTVEFRANAALVWPVGPRYIWNEAVINGTAAVSLAGSAPQVVSLTLANSSTLTLNGINMVVDGTLTSTDTPTILGSGTGNTLTARRFQVNGLTVDNARLILNENGIPQTQQFNNVTFQTLTAPGAGNALLNVTGFGTAGRTLTFNNVNFPTISNGFYASLIATGGQNLDLVLAGSNQAVIGAQWSDPPNEVRSGNALIDWQP